LAIIEELLLSPLCAVLCAVHCAVYGCTLALVFVSLLVRECEGKSTVLNKYQENKILK
jgi:hypothetical protein